MIFESFGSTFGERDGRKHITKAMLKQRGWTDGMIKEYLTKPCKTGVYNNHNKKNNVSLWHIDRVKTMESMEEVKKLIEKVKTTRKTSL